MSSFLIRRCETKRNNNNYTYPTISIIICRHSPTDCYICVMNEWAECVACLSTVQWKKDFWKSSGNILLKFSYKKKACNTWILENLHEKRMKNCYPIFSIWVITEIKKMYHQRVENSEILTTPDYTRFFIRICFIRNYMWIYTRTFSNSLLTQIDKIG